MFSELVLATTNQGKKIELEKALADCFFSLETINQDFDCPEDQNSFTGNSIQKAQMASAITNKFCLADDSGLCVEALNGEPGIYSARYFENGKGLNKILNSLEKFPDKNSRRAYFVCALVLCSPEGEIVWQTEKKWHGHIAQEISGTNGFGYDPIFIPDNFSMTAGQMEVNLKNSLSHRGQAIAEFNNYLKTIQ